MWPLAALGEFFKNTFEMFYFVCACTSMCVLHMECGGQDSPSTWGSQGWNSGLYPLNHLLALSIDSETTPHYLLAADPEDKTLAG